MVVLNVKNTMIERVLEIIAPHPCISCGKVGLILCVSCKYDIIHEPFGGCILCEWPQKSGICLEHGAPLEKAFVVSDRFGSLSQIIDALKLQRTRAAASVLAELLNERLPEIPGTVVLVPVPTLASHARQRGYDQVKLITRYLGALRNYSVEDVLVRTKNTTQHLVGRTERANQAKGLYVLKDTLKIDPAVTYLLIDDIITTGATVLEASRCIQEAGGKVWVAALAYQSKKAST